MYIIYVQIGIGTNRQTFSRTNHIHNS